MSSSRRTSLRIKPKPTEEIIDKKEAEKSSKPAKPDSSAQTAAAKSDNKSAKSNSKNQKTNKLEASVKQAEESESTKKKSKKQADDVEKPKSNNSNKKEAKDEKSQSTKKKSKKQTDDVENESNKDVEAEQTAEMQIDSKIVAKEKKIPPTKSTRAKRSEVDSSEAVTNVNNNNEIKPDEERRKPGRPGKKAKSNAALIQKEETIDTQMIEEAEKPKTEAVELDDNKMELDKSSNAPDAITPVNQMVIDSTTSVNAPNGPDAPQIVTPPITVRDRQAEILKTPVKAARPASNLSFEPSSASRRLDFSQMAPPQIDYQLNRTNMINAVFSSPSSEMNQAQAMCTMSNNHNTNNDDSALMIVNKRFLESNIFTKKQVYSDNSYSYPQEEQQMPYPQGSYSIENPSINAQVKQENLEYSAANAMAISSPMKQKQENQKTNSNNNANVIKQEREVDEHPASFVTKNGDASKICYTCNHCKDPELIETPFWTHPKNRPGRPYCVFGEGNGKTIYLRSQPRSCKEAVHNPKTADEKSSKHTHIGCMVPRAESDWDGECIHCGVIVKSAFVSHKNCTGKGWKNDKKKRHLALDRPNASCSIFAKDPDHGDPDHVCVTAPLRF